jgi:GT2 family glycosyltransferase
MVKVSIACLIYKSVRWLQFVYDQVHKYTDMTDKEFYFVANDANDAVLTYLKDNKIPHYIHNNTEEQRKEWYISNVYRAWNTAGRVAKGEYVVFINSDMAFTPGWLERLIETITPNRMVCSRLVERGVLSSGLYGIERNFGNVPDDYKENEFIEYTKQITEFVLRPSGLYMPCLIKKEHLEQIGYYPEGNILPGTHIFDPIIAKKGEPCIPGDKVFVAKLQYIGVEHWTNFASVVYHFQEGEMRDTVDN